MRTPLILIAFATITLGILLLSPTPEEPIFPSYVIWQTRTPLRSTAFTDFLLHIQTWTSAEELVVTDDPALAVVGLHHPLLLISSLLKEAPHLRQIALNLSYAATPNHTTLDLAVRNDTSVLVLSDPAHLRGAKRWLASDRAPCVIITARTTPPPAYSSIPTSVMELPMNHTLFIHQTLRRCTGIKLKLH